MTSLPRLLIVVLLMILGSLALSCGGDGDGGGGLTLEDYFQQVDAIFQDRDDRA